MKRSILAVVAMVFSVSMALAATSSAAQRDVVKGTAQHLGADPPYPVIQVRINARADSDGADARGHVRAQIKSLGIDDRARVVCLSVVGNTATVGTRIVKSNDPSLVGQGQLWNVVDNGQSGVDQIAGYPYSGSPPTACPPLPFSVPLISGNYVVQGATP